MDRVFHTWDKWECYPAGFYENKPDGITQDDGELAYVRLLSDVAAFDHACKRVINEWVFSCEHYLTNEKMNRVAWMGQAAACITLRIPACCRGGYNRLSEGEQLIADMIALHNINLWMTSNGHPVLDPESVKSKTEANIY